MGENFLDLKETSASAGHEEVFASFSIHLPSLYQSYGRMGIRGMRDKEEPILYKVQTVKLLVMSK